MRLCSTIKLCLIERWRTFIVALFGLPLVRVLVSCIHIVLRCYSFMNRSLWASTSWMYIQFFKAQGKIDGNLKRSCSAAWMYDEFTAATCRRIVVYSVLCFLRSQKSQHRNIYVSFVYTMIDAKRVQNAILNADRWVKVCTTRYQGTVLPVNKLSSL